MSLRNLVLSCMLLGATIALAQNAAPAGLVASAEKKLQHIQDNGASAHPDPTPTELTEEEINAYIAAGNLELPPGLQSVRLRGEAGVITATTRVDFDKLRGLANSSNPLLAIFSGVHEVVVVAHANGSEGEAVVQVDSVSLDQVEIPQFVLELFVQKYIQPKYPDIGLDSRFKLPNRIATATVRAHRLVIVQK